MTFDDRQLNRRKVVQVTRIFAAMSPTLRKTLLEPGHEAEWAELNREKREYQRRAAQALTPSERVASGLMLSRQAVQVLASTIRAAMSHPEPSGPDLDGVVADIYGELPMDPIPGLDS